MGFALIQFLVLSDQWDQERIFGKPEMLPDTRMAAAQNNRRTENIEPLHPLFSAQPCLIVLRSVENNIQTITKSVTY